MTARPDPADIDRIDVDENRQWIEDWRNDMFSSTSRDECGWPIEMHGVVASLETAIAEVVALRAERDEAFAQRDHRDWVLAGEREAREAAERERENANRQWSRAEARVEAAEAEAKRYREALAKPVKIARLFHETYERLAPNYGYKTREESAVPWELVPEPNRDLMIEVATVVGAALASAAAADTTEDTDA